MGRSKNLSRPILIAAALDVGGHQHSHHFDERFTNHLLRLTHQQQGGTGRFHSGEIGRGGGQRRSGLRRRRQRTGCLDGEFECPIVRRRLTGAATTAVGSRSVTRLASQVAMPLTDAGDPVEADGLPRDRISRARSLDACNFGSDCGTTCTRRLQDDRDRVSSMMRSIIARSGPSLVGVTGGNFSLGNLIGTVVEGALSAIFDQRKELEGIDHGRQHVDRFDR